MHTEQWLKAGGYVLDQDLPNIPVDRIDARVFVHPAIPGREVVRLTPDSLAPGEDSAMELFGYECKGSDVGVAMRMRQALGFPDWILVNHPADAKLALSTARELKKRMRGAKSKPGNARDLVIALTKDLEKTHPHFLPSLYEEIARMFVEAGNTTYASTFFGKAREAEQMYALAVDEEQRRDAFVEFALNGALSNKVMTEYAKVLQTNHGPEKAYAYFYDLCVRRTLGGTPVSAQMVTDLRKMAKTAGKNATEEDTKFIQDVWESPALAFSARKFWELYATTYARLAKTLPGLKGRLLNMFPRPSSSGDDFKAFWIGFLGDVGALDALTNPDAASVPESDRPEGSAAAWFEKLSAHKMTSGWGGWGKPDMPDEGFVLLRKMADRLKADGVELKIPGYYNQGDVDLVDLALELKIPVAVGSLNLDIWHRGPEASKERRRDLSFVAADKRFKDALDSAVGAVFANAEFQLAAKGKKGLKAARQAYLRRRIEGLENGFIQSWMPGDAITNLAAVPAATYAEFPELMKRADALTPVPALMRSFEMGVMQELSWPEYDEAYAELKQGDQNVLSICTFPYVYLYNLRKAIVVGPGGRVLEHDFAFKVTNNYQRIRVLRYAKKQLFVAYYNDSWQMQAYWSGNPQNHFDFSGWHSNIDLAELPDGRIFEGERAFGPPDTVLPGAYGWISDGTTFWRKSWDSAGWGLQEVDPETGRLGRKSMPAFLEDFASADNNVLIYESILYKIPAGVNSLLGSKDGLWGVRARSNKTTGVYEVESIVGDVHNTIFAGALTFPGTHKRSFISTLWQNQDGFEVISHSPYRTLPLAFLHLMKWSDAKGSEALRKVDASTVAQWVLETVGEALSAEVGPRMLLAKGQLAGLIERLVALGADKARAKVIKDALEAETKPKANTAALIQDTLKCNPDLAGRLHQMLHDAFVQFNALSTVIAVAKVGPATSDISIQKVMGSLGVMGVSYYAYSHDGINLASVLSRVNGSLKGEPLGDLTHGFPEVLIGATLLPGSIYWAGFRSESPEEIANTLRMIASTVDPPGTRRRLMLVPFNQEASDKAGISLQRPTVLKKGTSQFLVVRGPTCLLAFECADGEFVNLDMPDVEVVDWAWPGKDALEAWAVELEQKKLSLDKEVIEELAKSSGLTFTEAAVLWTAGPGWNTWEKNFLPKELRESLGLKVAEANAARQSLKTKVQQTHLQMTSHVTANCSDITGIEAARAYGKAWKSKFGGYQDLMDSEVAAALESLSIYNARDEFRLNFGEKSRALVAPAYKVVKGTWGDGHELHNEGLHEYALNTIVTMIFWLGNTLPSSHPVRAHLKTIGDSVRAAIRNEDQIFRLGTIYGYAYGDEIKKQMERFNLKPGKVEDEGLTLAVVENYGIGYYLRSHRYLKGERNHHFEVIKDHPLLKRLDYIASDDFQRNLEWFAAPPQGCMYNPVEAVPELVEKVRDTLNVTVPAAQLYLQTLALPDVRSASVKAWNGWSSKVYNSACEELTKAGHLVEAKRARAGRNHFIDGPWLALKAPHLPVEAWKESMVRADANSPLMPMEPLPDLFRRAWSRVESGDKPGF